MTKKENTELAPVSETATAVAVAPAFSVETTSEDMVLPFLKIIQSQADEVTRGKDKYNENVRPGDIYDSVTRTIYKDPEIIICGIRKYYGEWEGTVRGKLIAKHRKDSTAVANAKRIPKVSPKGTPYEELQSEAGNALIETFGIVCIVKQNGTALPATFTLSKTSFNIGKTLNTLVAMNQSQGVPVFKMSVNTRQNDKGSWYVPVFELAGFEKDETIIANAAGVSRIVDDIIFAFSPEEMSEPATNDDVV